MLDEGNQSKAYSTALNRQIECIKHPELTPSARMLQEMRERHEGFFDFALRMSKQHEAYFRSIKISNSDIKKYNKEARKSLEKQAAMEAEQGPDFEHYLQAYFNQA